jgi:hypothetical protein
LLRILRKQGKADAEENSDYHDGHEPDRYEVRPIGGFGAHCRLAAMGYGSVAHRELRTRIAEARRGVIQE